MSSQKLPVLGFVWEQFGAYHMDRLSALGEHLVGKAVIVGLEVATTSNTYGWAASGKSDLFQKITLFPGENSNAVGRSRMFLALARTLIRQHIDTLFVTGYESPTILALAIAARLSGRRVIVMNDSKFDDKPRYVVRELIKWAFMTPYNAAFASGNRAREYFGFFGFSQDNIVEGYDAVGLDRLRASAYDSPVVDWEERNFLIVARLVEKKNIRLALEAFASYSRLENAVKRRLRICGSGPLLDELAKQAGDLGIAHLVDMLGPLSQERVADEMSRALCLVLPSREEQWGLVVNEALAFGLPVIVSNNTGACDSLVVNLKNGFILDPKNLDSWIVALGLIGTNKGLFEDFSAESSHRAWRGDVPMFVEGCLKLARLA